MISVLEPGLLTTVQDAGGRRGWQRLGVPTSGAADPLSARLANRLVGNPDGAALLEVTLVGPVLRFERALVVAIAGAQLDASLDGLSLPPETARLARAGSTLRFGLRRGGLRAYVAVGGGIRVDEVLGSAATDLRSRFGGVHGRPLLAGDRLAVNDLGHEPAPFQLTGVHESAGGSIRVVAGPHPERFGTDALDRFCATTWRVAAESDRAGVRLAGPPLPASERGEGAEIASVGLPMGAIQVPPDGQPIIMLADRPVTGGYAVVGCVARADIGRVAQLSGDDEVRFEPVSLGDAVEALRAQERRLAAVRPVGPDAAGGASWAGSLS